MLNTIVFKIEKKIKLARRERKNDLLSICTDFTYNSLIISAVIYMNALQIVSTFISRKLIFFLQEAKINKQEKFLFTMKVPHRSPSFSSKRRNLNPTYNSSLTKIYIGNLIILFHLSAL